jgi:DNA-binding response OmpR family regulator
LVEDEPSDVLLVEDALGTVHGVDFDVDAVDTLADGQQRLEKTQYDVILLDLGLPDSSGLATFDAVRRAAGSTPMLVLTAQDDEQIGVRTVNYWKKLAESLR